MVPLEVRIPISPTASMINRVHLIAHSIRSLGGLYCDAHIRASVGSADEPFDIEAAYPHTRAAQIEWSWVPRKEFIDWGTAGNPNLAAMVNDRFKPPFKAHRVLFLDADVLAIAPFDELFASSSDVQGVMAHVSPFHQHTAMWEQLFTMIGVQPKGGIFQHEHSGWGIMEFSEPRRLSPPYFNTGVMMFSDAAAEALYQCNIDALTMLRSKVNSYFADQIALTLAMYLAGCSYEILPLRYNFPNQVEFDRKHAEELAVVKFIHFLRQDVISRGDDFVSLAAMERFAQRGGMQGSNERLRARVEELLPLLKADY